MINKARSSEVGAWKLSRLRALSSEQIRRRRISGFTLVELLISIALTVIISSSVYFAINSALDSWSYCNDQLSLQKVLAEAMDKVINGTVRSYGLKDSLEIVTAGRARMEFIPPWVDDTHAATSNRNFTYTLNKTIKPGAAVPIGEIKMAEADRWRLVPVQLVPLENSLSTPVKLGLSVPDGSELRFIYHPDWIENPDVMRRVYWDKKTKEIMFEFGDTVESLSKNPFGVDILNVNFKYYSTNNQLVSEQEWVDEADVQVITGVQVEIEAHLGQYTQKLVRFVNLRNAPMRTGYLTLHKGMRIPIPDSKTIKALMITNLSGIANNDILQLEALPRAGTAWRVTVEFERRGGAKPTIRKINVESPPQVTVYTEYPKVSTDLGVNLLLLGQDGLYDYDDDPDTQDVVMLEGDVVLYVNEMNIKGAGLFVRP